MGGLGKAVGHRPGGHTLWLCVCVRTVGHPELWEGQDAKKASLLWLAGCPVCLSPLPHSGLLLGSVSGCTTALLLLSLATLANSSHPFFFLLCRAIMVSHLVSFRVVEFGYISPLLCVGETGALVGQAKNTHAPAGTCNRAPGLRLNEKQQSYRDQFLFAL